MSKISLTPEGDLYVPDNLSGLFHKIATQIRFHTISGKNEALTVGDIVTIAQEFFEKQHAHKTASQQNEINNVRAELALAKAIIADNQESIKRKSQGIRKIMRQLRSLRQTVRRRRKHAK